MHILFGQVSRPRHLLLLQEWDWPVAPNSDSSAFPVARDQFAKLVAVSVALQKEGGALVQPMVTTRDSATRGASPGEVGSNATKGRIESRESWSL